MKVFLVAVPLFDPMMAVAAYRMCDRSAENPLDARSDFRGMREVMLSPGLDLVQMIGLEAFAGDKPLFVDVNGLQLLSGMPTRVDINLDQMVCVLPSKTPVAEDVSEKCAELHDKGYHFAMDGYPGEGTDNPLLQYLDYIILDCKDPQFSIQLKTMNREMRRMRIIISNVPDMDAFHMLSSRNSALFTGDFFKQPITEGLRDLSPLKINALQLLKRVSEEDFELSEITRIIARDPALTLSLLRFINSGAVGLSRQVDSIENAVAILGQLEVRRWATVAISVSLAEDRPTEITRVSMIRAKFAENLAPAFDLFDVRYSLFLTGLFSLLDIIVQKPMSEAISDLAVDDIVKDALVEKKGTLYKVMELIDAYEHADWDRASIIMIRNNTNINVVSAAFIDALVWYNKLLVAINREANSAEPEPAEEEA
ncbi:HDOD domain-containing protein [Ruminococcaceae bacterium OttesenSCG-928-I18]|nr:HDOD domain-containing protein [Ruminococcaceae bacterium OttesenSCG-928-I18]